MDQTAALTRRYEVVDVQTGRTMGTSSFLLSPMGEELHLLSGPVTGNTLDGDYSASVYITQPSKPSTRHHEVMVEALRWTMAKRLIKEMNPQHAQYLLGDIERRVAEAEGGVIDPEPGVSLGSTELRDMATEIVQYPVKGEESNPYHGMSDA